MNVLHVAIFSALVLVASAAAAQPSTVPGPAMQLSHAIVLDPSPSPDGRKLVHIRVVSGKEQLFVMDSDGANPTQITHGDYDHEDPAWSPDGRKIAYVSYADGLLVIHTINPDGSGDEAVTPPDRRVIHPNWAADSLSIAYCTNDDLAPPRKNDSDIWSVDLRTRKTTLLITGGTNTYPSQSRDGSKIAFRRMVGDDSEVFIANRDGSQARNLSNSPATFDGWPAWSPDNRQIAFASNRGGTSYRIYVMRPDGSDVRLVADTVGRATAPQWSPDGKTLYFPNCHKVGGGTDCEVYAASAPPLTAAS